MAVAASEALLGDLVVDLTSERGVVVQPEMEVLDPTINTRTHEISVSSRSLGANVRVIDRVRIEPGDLVFSRLHTQNGAFAFSDQAFLATKTFVPLRVRDDLVNPRYLYWALHVRVPTLWTTDTVGRETFTPSEILGLRVPVPTRAKQDELAGQLDTLHGLVTRASELVDTTRVSCEQAVVRHREARFSELLGREVSTLRGVARLERGRFSHRPRNDPMFYGGDHPWIQIGEIEAAGKIITSYSETLNDAGLSVSRKFPKGTLLVSIAATIGAVGILGFDCCIPDSIVAVQPGPLVTPDFLYEYFLFIRSHLEQVAPRSAQKNINLEILNAARVPVPELGVQSRIVDELSRLGQCAAKVAELAEVQSRRVRALFPSVASRTVRI